MTSFKHLTISKSVFTFASQGRALRSLGAMALLAGVGFTAAACSSDPSTAELYNQTRGDRYYHTNLYDQPTSGVEQLQKGTTSRVEGQSPLTANLRLLDAQQKAAIDELKRMREERKNASF